jgi:bacteriocin biosynthesis cyclodehydratase domain-containing protein
MVDLGDDLGRFRLAPGLRVVRRGLSHLQIGLYDVRRALLPRTPEVESTLAALVERRPVEPGTDSLEALATLHERGCLVAFDDHSRARGRLHGSRVSVLGDLAGARDLLIRAGVRVVAAGTRADVALVGGPGEVDRDRLDPLIRTSTTHLVVRLVDGAAILGPFVVPGVTACLRCIDAQLSVADPDHVPVTSRYVRATARPRDDGMPEVTDPLLATLAVAWAVRDAVAHLDGRRPATWSRTVFLDPEPTHRREQDWSRHPECGCSWSADALASGTMGV